MFKFKTNSNDAKLFYPSSFLIVHKILCLGGALLGIIVISLTLSFAQSEKQNQTQSFQPFFKQAQSYSSSEPYFLEKSQEPNEVSVTAVLPDYPSVRVSDYRGY